ncbi:MAG: hypothetical protein IT368_16460 [Candidatus Hydrogenedentes bacterium]|nr:hypothetical protein [Candidatus Hydrogenedentota bacterium]
MSEVKIQNQNREILLVQPGEKGQQVIQVSPSQVPALVERLFLLKAELDKSGNGEPSAKEAREDSFGAL